MNLSKLIKTLPPDWQEVLLPETEKLYFKLLSRAIRIPSEEATVYPPSTKILRALQLTPLSEVRVVLLGQDPYIKQDQANGLAFSVNKGIALPPSLQNIFKELKQELDIPFPKHGDLTSWAKQGVLLLNTVLTVEEGRSGSHHNLGWETFTKHIITNLNKKKNLIFVLWGAKAQQLQEHITETSHTVLKTTHPSPFSAHKGFFGCRHFIIINKLLEKPINWTIS